MLVLFVWASNVPLYGVPSGLSSSMPSDIMRIVLASGHGTIMDLGEGWRRVGRGARGKRGTGHGDDPCAAVESCRTRRRQSHVCRARSAVKIGDALVGRPCEGSGSISLATFVLDCRCCCYLMAFGVVQASSFMLR